MPSAEEGAREREESSRDRRRSPREREESVLAAKQSGLATEESPRGGEESEPSHEESLGRGEESSRTAEEMATEDTEATETPLPRSSVCFGVLGVFGGSLPVSQFLENLSLCSPEPTSRSMAIAVMPRSTTRVSRRILSFCSASKLMQSVTMSIS